jgi:hypothetical protein
MLSSVGGRKAAACLTALIIAVLAVMFKGDVPPGLIDMMKYIVGVYVAANVGSDLVAVAQSHVDKKETTVTETVTNVAPPVQPDPAVGEALGEMAKSITGIQQGVAFIISRIGPPSQN